MNHLARALFARALLVGLALGAIARCRAQEGKPPRSETAEDRDGSKAKGRLAWDRAGGLIFVPEGASEALPWGRIAQVVIAGSEPDADSGPAPFQVQLGLGSRLSGRLVAMDDAAVQLDPGRGRKAWAIARGGVSAVVQRPGEIQALRDGFEALDSARWSQTGDPRANREVDGRRALELPAGGASITTRLPEPLGSGRVELLFRDDAAKVAGQRWFVDLTCRKANSDLATLRVVPGWADETLAVETPGGPALTVQPLARKPGWHRLAVRFDAERSAVAIDGDDLAHGRGLGGPLIEVRIACETAGAAQPPGGLAATVDDLRVVRLAEPTGVVEVDPGQDEVRLASGDQLFGRIVAADGESIRMDLDGRALRAAWTEAAGLYLRRTPASSARIDGLWAEVEWRTAAGDDPRDVDRVEAAIVAMDEANLRLAVPYVGEIEVPRDALTRLSVQGRGARVVIDARSHHLGDRLDPDLDPPHAERAPVEIPFTLADLPVGPASLLIDAVKAIGEEGTPDYSDLVKQGQLRTTATINGRKVDDLNGYVSSRTESPQRLHLPIPPGVLKAGANTLRLDQAGTKLDPKLRDNLGVLRIAVEFATPGGAKAGAP